MCLMLFLGGRRQAAIRLGAKNVRTIAIMQPDGSHIHQRSMVYVPRKTRYKRLDESVPPLEEAIRATAIGIHTFLVTAFGKPFTGGGFGNKMRQWCNEAGLAHCTAHGLKKAAATCAEMGASDRQMMALFDWTSEKQATTYTRKANRTRIASAAGGLLGSFSWERLVEVSRQAEGVPNRS